MVPVKNRNFHGDGRFQLGVSRYVRGVGLARSFLSFFEASEEPSTEKYLVFHGLHMARVICLVEFI